MKKRKPIVLIDQDDVLAEYIKAIAEAFNKKHGTKFQCTDCKSWDLISVFGEGICEIMHEPDLFRKLEPVKDALEVFERLYKSELFDMYIVTAAQPSSVEAKFEWIQKYMPYFPLTKVIVCSVKNMIKGDYLLDDGMHNIRAFAEAGGTSIVFNRPHNYNDGKEFQRIYGWKEFEEFITEECYGVEEEYMETEEKAI